MTDTAPRETGLAGEDVVIEQSVEVHFSYPVVFTREVFARENPVLDATMHRCERTRRQRGVVFIDQGVAACTPDLISRIEAYFAARAESLELAAPPLVVSGGPAAKNGWGPVREVMSTLGDLHMDRQSFVIAVGGGSMLDMVGFASAIVHRGLRLLRLPTTTLAQNDSGVGVKNGMDEQGQKNFVGTFAPPFGVINDAVFLATLPDEHWLGGIAEAVKVAAIKDVDFLTRIQQAGASVKRRDTAGRAAMEAIVRRCAELHLEHIRTSGDSFEFGSARPLDFGHWAAHKLETLTRYDVAHGQAVAIGIAVDACYAHRLGHISQTELNLLLASLTDCGLPVFHPSLLERAKNGEWRILEGLRDFREHLGGTLCITLPSPLGRKTEIHEIDESVMIEVIQGLARAYPESLFEPQMNRRWTQMKPNLAGIPGKARRFPRNTHLRKHGDCQL